MGDQQSGRPGVDASGEFYFAGDGVRRGRCGTDANDEFYGGAI